ncbi:MAG: hypothetical protein IPK16_12590 [Anaerolineales bacterium]|nr:hypothetical protein [Anaerolineales bacterium]
MTWPTGRGEIDFTWQGTVTGSAEGVITYSIAGQANRTFWKNRIGFCILHPGEVAGSACRILHADGVMEAAALPTHIIPHQPLKPFEEMAGLAYEAMPSVWVETDFTGDIFEMEDQRNWTDASFKTFSTPLRLPYPVQLHAGEKVVQTLTLRVSDARGDAQPVMPREEARVKFAPLHNAQPVPLPAIGLGVATHGRPLTSVEVGRMAILHPHHLRADLWPAAPDAETELRRATEDAHALGIGLELALFLGDSIEAELAQAYELLTRVRPPIAAWLVFPATEMFWGGSPIAQVVAAARPVLKTYADSPLGSGTNADFIFMQRNLPPLEAVDLLAYAVNPQVHAFDNLSLIETLACQGATVRSAQRLGKGRPVYVTPVTLKMRHNPYATANASATPAGELPPQVDPRQMSLFGAAWTLGSIKRLAESGAASVTYYETTGWRGVMEERAGAAVPQKFHSVAGGVFPLYHVLADIATFAGGEVLPATSTDALAVDGLVLRAGGAVRYLVANLSPKPQQVEIAGLGAQVFVRMLDASNVLEAMVVPGDFRMLSGEPHETASGQLTLMLAPYAVARLDTH